MTNFFDNFPLPPISFVETRCLASLQWKQSLTLSTFDKLIGGKQLFLSQLTVLSISC